LNSHVEDFEELNLEHDDKKLKILAPTFIPDGYISVKFQRKTGLGKIQS